MTTKRSFARPKRAARQKARTPVRRKVTPKRWHKAVIADYARFIAWPNVERVAVGWKERDRKVTRRMSVKIYVRQKLDAPENDIELPRWTYLLVPTSGDRYRRIRVPTDVVTHAEVAFCAAPTDFLNPVQSGALIRVPGGEIGTYACMVTNATGQQFALTAGHVIRRVAGPIGAGSIPVQQPAQTPPGMPSGATLLWGRTVAGGFLGNLTDGFRDFALIRLDSRGGVSQPLDGFASSGAILSEPNVVNNKLTVTKFGAVTGRTSAVFATRVPTITVEGMVANEVWEFVGAGVPFAQRGDSGALVVSTAAGSLGAIVGLVFATASATLDAPGGRAFVFPFGRIAGFKPA